MKISTISLLVDFVFILNIVVGVGNYYTAAYSESFTNLTNLTFSGDIRTYSFNESEFNNTAEQLEQNPTQESSGVTLKSLRAVFFGLPDLVYDIMGKVGLPLPVIITINAGVTLMMFIIYLLFGLQVISYFMGGGE